MQPEEIRHLWSQTTSGFYTCNYKYTIHLNMAYKFVGINRFFIITGSLLVCTYKEYVDIMQINLIISYGNKSKIRQDIYSDFDPVITKDLLVGFYVAPTL